MKTLNSVALALTIIGGINWLLVGLAHLDLATALFGDQSAASRIAYVIIGLASLYCLSLFALIAGEQHERFEAEYAGQRPQRSE